MAVDHPTDIMLGRGPTCYNNPGNRLFRKVVKANAIYYKSKARRKDKAALVVLLISKLEAKGCRFLHRSSCGTWVEALSTIVKKKVGHALRDARLAADKAGGEMNVLPKNFRPAIANQKHTHQRMPFSVPIADIKQTQERRIEESGNKEKISIGTNTQCNDFPMDQQKSFMDSTASSGFPRYIMHDTMMADSAMMIQERQQAIQDDNAPSFLNKLLDYTYHSQSCTLATRRCEQHSLDFFDREIESLDLCEGCDDISYIMYGRFEESSDGCLVDDSSQSSVCSLDYGHNVFQL